MPILSKAATDHWKAPFLNGAVLYSDDTFMMTVNPDLEDNERVMLLEPVDGPAMAVLTLGMASLAGLEQPQNMSLPEFRSQLQRAGIILHGADYVFFFPEDEKARLMKETTEGNIRRLTAADAAAFEAFCAASSEEDLDGAYVELDHWRVMGVFEGEQLVCAASMYPWNDTAIADLGVLTLTAARGKGYARRLTRAICRLAYEEGYEPQYRCQLDNQASVALAKAVGVMLFAKWDMLSEKCAL
ncbi:GNAT family N-acetyltransferase [Chitinophaga sp. G-6-1-13]|uniref:GNAT family N-acetyltransferase n=1 Tax=Chitinophaga fulva TaxID=2728842 RepID=A0A848GHI3_9BACT|nr:GNAT family N-acetyltransferase [Chitinophaga fulva]NML37277.1 GNAT family N-acetyltransferase [Chitinophaga fulva]